jgi:hypothetical protein
MEGFSNFQARSGSDGDTERFIREYLKKQGWDILYKLSITRENTEHLIEAAIDNYTWNINLRLDPNFEAKIRKIVNKEIINIVDPEKKTVAAVVKHEKSHWDACPIDIEYLEAILDGTSVGLKNSGLFDDNEIKQYTPYVANMFCDIIVNSIVGLKENDEDFLEGIELLYLQEACLARNSGQLILENILRRDNKNNVNYYAIFVDAQMKIYQHSERARSLAKKFGGDYEEVNKASKDVIKILTNEHIAEKMSEGKADETDKRFALQALEDRLHWKRKSMEFASMMAKYLKNNLDNMKRRIKLNPLIDKMTKDDNFRREVIRKGLEKGSSLLYTDDFEYFDEIYKSVADEIVLEFLKKGKEEVPRLPLFYMKRRRIEEGDSFEGIEWGRTIFVDTGKQTDVWLFKGQVPYQIDIEGLSDSGSFEDLLFMVDVSGTMGWSGEPLDGSRYDMALRSIYSVLNYLENTGKGHYLKYGLIMFSDPRKTMWSGWKSYSELEELKRHLFKDYQGRDTILDEDKVRETYTSKHDNFLALMVTDGDIHNPEEAKYVCKKLIEDGNDFVIFQIRFRSEFAEYMRRNGAAVVNVDKPEDLVGLILRKVGERYSPIIIDKR